MSEGKAANEKYGIEYTVSQEIMYSKEIKSLDAKGNDMTHHLMSFVNIITSYVRHL